MALLEIEGLRAGRGSVEVLHGLSFSVAAGEALGVVGPNGAGKTTLLRVLAGLDEGSGRIRFAGQPVDALPTEARVEQGLMLVPDTRGTLLALTVEDNLRLGAHTRRDRQRLRGALDQVLHRFPELARRLRQQAGTLSGGEQQLLAIARALMARPSLLMIDEATAGLAPQMVERVFDALASVCRTDGLALLMTAQEPGRMARLADRLLLLDTGQVLLQGPAAQIRIHPRLREVLLGAAQ
ncbi:MAG: hypothetical protein RL322_3087 [Pseudomonadota bacterium]|jgi:branched-chain amino acid transport system ATP-binding protein